MESPNLNNHLTKINNQRLKNATKIEIDKNKLTRIDKIQNNKIVNDTSIEYYAKLKNDKTNQYIKLTYQYRNGSFNALLSEPKNSDYEDYGTDNEGYEYKLKTVQVLNFDKLLFTEYNPFDLNVNVVNLANPYLAYEASDFADQYDFFYKKTETGGKRRNKKSRRARKSRKNKRKSRRC